MHIVSARIAPVMLKMVPDVPGRRAGLARSVSGRLMLDAVTGLDACVTAVPGRDALNEPCVVDDLAVIGREGREAVTGGPRPGPLAEVGGPLGIGTPGPDGDSDREDVVNARCITGLDEGEVARMGFVMVMDPRSVDLALLDIPAEGFRDKIFGVLEREPPIVRTSGDSSLGFKSSLNMTRVNSTMFSLFEAKSKQQCELNLPASNGMRRLRGQIDRRHSRDQITIWAISKAWPHASGAALLTLCSGAWPMLHLPAQRMCIANLLGHRRAQASTS